MANEESVAGRQWLRTRSRGAVRFIILLGVVSFFADATYESARSILGPFLASLGATGVTVSLIAGSGELLNKGGFQGDDLPHDPARPAFRQFARSA